MIRILERWLEMFDEKEVPLWECPIPSEKGKGQSEEAKEQEKGTNPEQTPAPSKITYICPLCDDEMQLKHAHKGGWFYGCSKWPVCNGYRNKTNKRPGPVAAVTKLRNIYGDATWADMEEKKCSGKFKIPIQPRLNKCLFCGMDPPNHLGRNCPQRNVYF